jgi:sortase (surface protein transpeptidase)
MEVPASFSVAGWFRPGPEPGERGAAVIAGHIASRRGPGVFLRLGALQRGAKVVVVLRNGSRKRFVVSGQKQVAKARFPTKVVFRRTAEPTLRLITCGGRFNSATGHHVDNVIVFASLDRSELR